MAGIRTCDRESQVQRPNHYTTEPPQMTFVALTLTASSSSMMYGPFDNAQE